VLNRRTLATTALLHGAIEPDKLGEQMLLAGYFFNEAWMANEVNAAGMATLSAIRSYPRLMPREGAPDYSVAPEDRPLEKLCWRTTTTSRDMLIDSYIANCRHDRIMGWSKKIRCLSAELAREESTFVRTKTGKREHRPTCHDDVLFATMIADRVHRTCPWEPAEDAKRVAPEVMQAVCEELGAVRPVMSDYGGGVDEWDPADDDEDPDETV